MINIFKMSRALSDGNRLKIIKMLSEGEKNVGDVAEKLNVEENLASHHLRVLATLGFLKSDKRGREVYYKINKTRFVTMIKELNKNETFSEILREGLIKE